MLLGESILAARNRLQRALTELHLPPRQSNQLRGQPAPDLNLPIPRRARSEGHRQQSLPPQPAEMEAIADYMGRVERMQFAISNRITK